MPVRWPPPPAAPPPKKPPAGKPPAPSEVSTGLAPPKPRRTLPVTPQRQSEVSTGLGSPAREPSFSGRPIPALQQFGYMGSIHDVNARVQAITDAYSKRFGVNPTPGLVFDVLRSPTDDFESLFAALPASKAAGRLQAATTQAKQAEPYEYFQKDKNGELVINNPLMEKIRQQIQTHPGPLQTPSDIAAEHADLLKASKEYPTVRAGEVIPLNTVSASTLFDAMNRIDKWVGPGNIKIGVGGMSVAQVNKLYLQARTHGDITKMRQIESIGSDIRAVQIAQKELNDRMGTNLPVTGVFSPDWNKAVVNWFKTPNYFRQAAIYQAQQAGFGSDYGALKRAIDFKQHAVRHHGFMQYLIAGAPLYAFSHGGGWGIAQGLFDGIVQPNSLGFSTPFHALTHTGGALLGGIGGTVTQAKAYSVASSAAFNDIMAGAGSNKSYDQAKADFKNKLLNDNPTWAHILFPNMRAHPKGLLGAVDQITNFAGDLFLLRKATFTGETVSLGDTSAALRSTRIRVGSHWAFRDLQQGNIGRGAAMLEGGAGAERLAAVAQPLIAKGKLGEQEFTNHVAELYATGTTTLKYGSREVTIQGVARPFDSLRLKNLPTPGRASQVPKRGLRNLFDNLDVQIRANPLVPDQAANFISSVRSFIGHAVPVSARNYFEPRLPERVHDLVLREFKDTALANEFESRLVRLRATENVVGIQKLDDELSQMLRAKYPEGRDTQIQDPFKPILESEAPSRFQAFSVARQGMREGGYNLQGIHNVVRTTNRFFNKTASYASRLVIISPKLAWKHVGDYFRRAIAQGTIRPGLSGAQKAAEAEITALVNADPKLSRALGGFLGRSRDSEVRYMTGNGATLRSPGAADFSTGAHFADANYMRGAGGYLHRMVDSKALAAYEKSSEADLSPLVNLILHDKEFKGLYRAAKKSSKVSFEDPGISPEDYAQVIWNRYQEVQDSAVAAGEHDFFTKAQQILQGNRGSGVRDALGNYIKEARVDFPVRKAEVDRMGGFDALSSKVIGVVMTANKWNRSQLAKRELYQIYSDLRASGASQQDAIYTAMSGAEKLVTHHMLDFANRLQVEQDLRWLSYFATKHRLYWKWVASTMARYPGAAAVITDVKQHLDSRGSFNFTVPFDNPLGRKLSIPAASLVWVPGRDYSELSPIAQGIAGAAVGGAEQFFPSAKGTFGNIFTRNDTGLRLLLRWAKMETGATATTVEAAAAGMDTKTKARLYKTANDYANAYFEEHGHYPSPAAQAKYALWHSAAEELWRANLPLPVQSQYADDPAQKLVGQYLSLVDPAKRRAFLDKNPVLAQYFGVYRNPAVYQHNREFFRLFNSARDTFRNERRALWAQAQQQGHWTPDMQKQSRASGQAYSGTINKLQLQDAAQTGKISAEGQLLLQDPKTDYSKVDPAKYILEKGQWAKTSQVDPLLDPAGFYHKLFPHIPIKDLSARTTGYNVKAAQAELARLNDPNYIKAIYGNDPAAESEIKTYRRRLLQFLSDFRNAPTNPVSKALDQYQSKYVDPFWKQRNKFFAHIATLPKGQKEVAYAKERAWVDQQDKPVTIDGVTFPSPIRSAWTNLDPITYKQNLAKLASSNWGHLANYEKELLTGKKLPAGVSEAWAQFDKGMAEWHQANPGARLAANQKLYVARVFDKQYPGFYKDYLFSLQNKERRFEVTTLYQDMPSSLKAKYEQNIGGYARVWREQLHSRGYTFAQADGVWHNYIDNQIVPWLNKPEQTGLKKELEPYGPDFLYSLVN